MLTAALGKIIIGWLIADLMSGLFHKWQDGGRVEWPVIGPWLIAPSVLHHAKPLAFLEGSWATRNLAAGMLVLSIAGAWLALLGPSIILASATVGGLLTTQVHAWAHRPSAAPRIVRVLQEIGILQSPKAHAGHHRPPHDGNYCALTNWLNPVLNDIGFWRLLSRR
jgi:ubiquitin-conjugating enzyme E2 variant